jgi:hypothetical protein
MKLLDILLKEEKKKESLKQSFHTYECEFLIKFEKKINKTQAAERIRGIKTVTTVVNINNSKIDTMNRNQTVYEYDMLKVNFITNYEPKKQLERIAYEMSKSNRDKQVFNIKGIVSAKPILDTLKKID